jgi:disulfide oxidoreductase YuzD
MQDIVIDGIVHRTEDYSLFKFSKYQKDVDTAHVNRVVESIKKNNMAHVFPIIVMPDMEVVDGRCRFEAGRSLGLPIYYKIVD